MWKTRFMQESMIKGWNGMPVTCSYDCMSVYNYLLLTYNMH